MRHYWKALRAYLKSTELYTKHPSSWLAGGEGAGPGPGGPPHYRSAPGLLFEEESRSMRSAFTRLIFAPECATYLLSCRVVSSTRKQVWESQTLSQAAI